jgi:hypothetical protein
MVYRLSVIPYSLGGDYSNTTAGARQGCHWFLVQILMEQHNNSSYRRKWLGNAIVTKRDT